jgi:hypothetical protein
MYIIYFKYFNFKVIHIHFPIFTVKIIYLFQNIKIHIIKI